MENLNDILDEIRVNRSALFSFFSMMPKGGDLHHHYSGSVYAESYVAYVVEKNYFVNTQTLEVVKELPATVGSTLPEWRRFDKVENLDQIKLKLLRKWSDKDFTRGVESSDEHFFATFGHFSVASRENYAEGLLELKKRAINQKLSYIETIFISLDLKAIVVPNESQYDNVLLYCQSKRDESLLESVLEELYGRHLGDCKKAAEKHNETVKQLHGTLGEESGEFVMRYQNYAARFRQPTDVFIELLACFHSAAHSALVVGVNIVAAENGDVAMRDYWLHMHFYGFLKGKYPNVRFAVHAGELTTGMVQPERLGQHLKEAVAIAGPDRIGHAVDIIYDNEFTDTMALLKQKKTVIEINLSSNEFILGVSHDMHPLELYYRNGIPIVICTDDEGVLRSSITEQYVILAYRYKLRYDEIKKLVFNSIEHSFIEEQAVKDQLVQVIQSQFAVFEEKITAHYLPIVFEAKTEDGHAIGDETDAAFVGLKARGFSKKAPKLKLTNFTFLEK